jgi:hypothetical protein
MADPDNTSAPRALTARELRSRRARNIAVGLAIAALAALFYAVTIVKLGPGILREPG